MPNGEVEFNWADGTYKFNIARIKSTLELEEKCDAGVAEIFKRLREDRWKINDIRETLRIGLIGGGMMPDKALRLVDRYGEPWVKNLQPAMVIMMAAMFGVPGDEVGKKAETDRAKEGRPSEKTADMSDPLSTASAQQSDSAREKQTR